MGEIGRPLRRREDGRLIRGAGAYASDIHPPGALHLHVVRSPIAHATVGSIDVSRARELPGVVAVWTAADLGGSFALPDSSAPWLPGRPRPTLAAQETCQSVYRAWAIRCLRCSPVPRLRIAT